MNKFTKFLLDIARTNVRMTTCGKPHQSQSNLPLFYSTVSTNLSIPELRKQTFQDVLPKIVNLILTHPQLQDAKEVEGWIKEILNYNLKGGKLARGLTAVMAYEMFEKPENITDESIQLSCILGWCTEMLQAYLLMADDIMDGAIKRRGSPCWYTLPGVGLRAVNDSVILYTTMNYILRYYFGHLPQFIGITDLFNETLLLTSVGQLYDCTMPQRNKNDYSLFTVELYDTVTKYKTSYYTYKLPVCGSMLLTNINDEKTLRQAEQICLKLGRIFQMQDDFLDVYGLESVTGKQLGADIKEGKCSWLAVNALRICNDAQRKVFTTSYCSSDPADVEKIKELYEELCLPDIYRQEQRSLYNEVVHLVSELDHSTRVPNFFLRILDEIHDRNK